MKRTGTDISIRECRSSGYAVVEHKTCAMDPSARYEDAENAVRAAREKYHGTFAKHS